MPSKSNRGYSSTIDYAEYVNGKIRQQPADNIRQQPTDSLRYNPWDFENPWSHNLCDLTAECNETCYGIWCFPCFACHLAWRMNESCWITFCLPGYLAVLRTKMRTAFRIKGSYFTDFCVAECCPLCAAVQMSSELRFRKVMS